MTTLHIVCAETRSDILAEHDERLPEFLHRIQRRHSRRLSHVSPYKRSTLNHNPNRTRKTAWRLTPTLFRHRAKLQLVAHVPNSQAHPSGALRAAKNYTALSLLQILLGPLRLTQQEWDVLVRRLHKPCDHLNRLFKFLGEFQVLLIAPSGAQPNKLAM